MPAKDSKTPVLTRIVQPSTVTLEDLARPDHPVNQTSMSGKSAGVGVLIGDTVYIATGSSPTATWKKFTYDSDPVGFPSGWAVYNDTEHSTVAQVIAEGTSATLENNAGTVINDYVPSDGALYDGSRVTPNTLGSNLKVRVTASVAANKTNGAFSLFVDISSAGDGSIEVARNAIRMVRGSNIYSKYTVTFDLYALETFIANGARIGITAEDGNISVKEIGYYIVK